MVNKDHHLKLLTLCFIAQFTITINRNVCPHIHVPNMLMRESYAISRTAVKPHKLRLLSGLGLGLVRVKVLGNSNHCVLKFNNVLRY